ncbi:MAG: uridine kinase [Pelagibacteraceae bacterium]
MSYSKSNFLKAKKFYLNFLKKQEVKGEPFYDKLGQLSKFYFPICNSISKISCLDKDVTVIGLSGGQGSGKTTIAHILKIILKKAYNKNVINFSIDDFYKTLSQREKMSKNIHPLFLIRGVPGTHDINLLNKSFKSLFKKKFKPFYIPKFDKSIDDRFSKKNWTKIKRKPEIVIFEGWCVGARQQKKNQLKKPLNKLEKTKDKNISWRKKVNNELKTKYKKLFNEIDHLIFLKVPSFKYVRKWRILQEKKLFLKSKGKKIMSEKQINEFVMFYERITRQMIKDLKKTANVVINLDKKHRLNDIKFN